MMTNEDAIKDIVKETCEGCLYIENCEREYCAFYLAIKALENQPKWIPVTERLPINTNPVNITWVNHQPESYYADIKDKPFTATGCFCDGKWYWYSSTCQDYLNYYRDCPFDAIDEKIEVLAWMPLPKPYTKEETT